jgi:hypothetical protein
MLVSIIGSWHIGHSVPLIPSRVRFEMGNVSALYSSQKNAHLRGPMPRGLDARPAGIPFRRLTAKPSSPNVRHPCTVVLGE